MKIFQLIVRWIHLLSFDAVLVGVAWQSIFSMTQGHTPVFHERFILASAIWLAYVADRLIDCKSLDLDQGTTERHKLYREHWLMFLVPWTLLFVFIIFFAFSTLEINVFLSGVVLVVLINLYYLFVRFARKIPLLGASKEILTAAIFSVGVSFFSLHHPNGEAEKFYLFQIAFGLLCLINLSNISFRDQIYSASQNEKTLPHYTQNYLVVNGLLLLATIGAGIYFIQMGNSKFAIPYLIGWASTVTYLIITRNKNVDTARYWADVPLMIPAVAFLLL